jgi:hypothetical protein
MRLQVADTDTQRDRGTLENVRAGFTASSKIHMYSQGGRRDGQRLSIDSSPPIVDYTLPVERHMISPSTLCRHALFVPSGLSEMLAGIQCLVKSSFTDDCGMEEVNGSVKYHAFAIGAST